MARRSGIQGSGPKDKPKKGLPGFGATPTKPVKPKTEKKPTVKPGFQATPAKPTKKTTRGQRAITREVYPTLAVKDRQRIVKSGRNKEAVRIHEDRMRASRALDALARFQKKHGDDLSGATPQVLKGARVQLRHRATLGEVPAVVRGSKTGVAGFSKRPHGLRVYGSVDLPKLKREEPKPKEKKAGLDFNPLHVVKSLAGGVVPDPSGLGGASGANAQRFNPQLHPEQTKELRGAFDGTTWALDQLNRISNAVGGAIEGAKAGGPDNLVTGAVKALKKNDNEVWTRLAHSADLPAWTGLLASIALDPTTYVSLGFKTPAEAARLQGFAKAAKDARALAKAGDEVGAIAKFKAAAADVEALSSKLEDTYRGIQVGVRNPFTGVVHGTKGKATAKAGRVSAPARDAAKDTKVGRPLNKLATSVSPRVRPVGVDRIDWQAMRNLEREASSVEHRIVRQGRQIGQHVVRVFGGDAKKVRAFVHRVEAGDLAGLPKAEKRLADQIISYHRSVADEYLKQTGKRLGLLDSLMLAPGDLKKASAAVQDALEAVAKRADRKGAQATRTLDMAQGRAEVLSRNVDDLPGERAAMRGEEYAGGGHGVRTARAEVKRQQAISEGARNLSKRLADPKPLTADDEEAFANLLRHITENIDAPDVGPVAAKVGRAQGQVDRLLKRLSYDPVENYLPREWESSLQASFQRGKRQGPRITTTGESQYELPRHDRRRLADIRAEGGDVWSDNLALLEAKYGVQMGRRLGTLALHKTVRDRFGRFATDADAAAIHSGKLVPYRLADDGRLQKIEKTESIAADELKDTIVLPDWVDKKLSTRLHSHGSWGAYDDLLRAFKTANTIIRPGFFATTFLGNFWQQFLRDLTPADMARSMGALGAIRRTDRAAQGGGARPVSAALKRLFPEETVIDGRRYTFERLFDEAAEYGAARTGAIFGDPTDISPTREAARRIKGAPKSGAVSRRLEAAGQLAEDMDDMTRLMMYRRARIEGMDPRRATEYTYTAMIDYTDLTKVERGWLKRIFPFYVYTARNLPIQIKRLVARPGKLANYEKVRSFIAQELGLPDDWESFLTEADQEQIPIPVGKLFKDKTGGVHVPLINPRLPVSDVSRPAQLLEGQKGLVRFLQSIGGQAGPVKVPFEVALNNRFDFNRPIRVDGYTPEAGTLLRTLGLGKPGMYSTKDKKEYAGVDPTLDYLLRALGGSPASLGLSIGRKLHDPSGVDPTKRGLASFLGGVGVRAPDTLSGPRERLMAEKNRAYSKQKRDEATPPKRGGGRGGEKSIADQDVIDRLKTLLTYVNAQLGDQRAIDDLPRVRHEEMNRRMNPPMSPRYRALERRMNRALRGY